MSLKRCSKCGEEKELCNFPNRKESKDGKRCECKSCEILLKKQYYDKNKEKIITSKRKYRSDYPDKSKNANKKYSKSHPEKIKEISKIYYTNNKHKIKEYHEIYNKEHKEQIFTRNSLKKIITDWKGSRTKYEVLLGYKLKDLKEHLSKFCDIKNSTVDHIIPISYLSKLIKDEKELARWSNDLRNLMLLDKIKNLSKNKFLTIEHVPYWHLQNMIDYCLELDEFINTKSEHTNNAIS